MPTLQDILADLPFADLPPAWQDHDLVRFSGTKRLWDYQQEALQYALKALDANRAPARDRAHGFDHPAAIPERVTGGGTSDASG